jgi:transcriptional regulator with XRE-family HTH domain
VIAVFWWKNPKRSKFGRWLDQEGITQVEFAERSKVSSNTIWRICNKKDYIPSPAVLKKLMDAVKKMDKNKQIQDFFDL